MSKHDTIKPLTSSAGMMGFYTFFYDLRALCSKKGCEAAIRDWDKPVATVAPATAEGEQEDAAAGAGRTYPEVDDGLRQRALGHIWAAMGDVNLRAITGDCKDARDAIARIHDYFVKDRGLRRITIRQQLNTVRLTSTIQELVDRIRQLKKEYDYESNDKLAESDMIAAFQRALMDDKSYAPLIRDFIVSEARGNSLNFDEMTRAAIGQQDIDATMRELGLGDERNERALQGNHGNGGGWQPPARRCGKCGGVGHSTEDCRGGRGRDRQQPAGRQQGGRRQRDSTGGRQGRDRGGPECWSCGERGHLKRDCKDRSERALVATTQGSFVVDTGSTVHMVGERRLLQGDVRPCNTPVSGVGGQTVRATHEGQLRAFPGKALLVPPITDNLLSIAQLCQNGWRADFSGGGMRLQAPDGRTYVAELDDNLYRLGATCYLAEADSGKRDMMYWHRILGHLGDAALRQACATLCDTSKWPKEPLDCSACAISKLTKTPVNRRVTHTEADAARGPGDRIDIDLAGPNEPSVSGARFSVDLMDRKTRYKWVAGIKRKDEAAAATAKILDAELGPKGLQCRAMGADRGGEFTGDEFVTMCKERRIVLKYAATDTPAHNGMIERQHRSDHEIVRALLNDAGLGPEFWLEALRHGALLHNVTPKKSLSGRSPWEAWHGTMFPLQSLLPFGARVLYYSAKGGRFGKRGHDGIYLGPALDTIGGAARILNLATDHVIVTRDYRLTPPVGIQFQSDAGTVGEAPVDDDSGEDEGIAISMPPSVVPDEVTLPVQDLHERPRATETGAKPVTVTTVSPAMPSDQPIPDTVREAPIDATAQAGVTAGSDAPAGAPTAAKPTVRRSERLATQRVSTAQGEHGGATSFLAVAGPRTYQEAMDSPDRDEWIASMHSEISSLLDLGAFHVIDRADLPAGARLLGAVWVNGIKVDENNRPVRYKSRLAAQGFNQIEGRDFDAISAPVASREGTRTGLATIAARGWEMRQFDFDTAYLNAELDKVQYMRPFPGLLELGGRRLNSHDRELLVSERGVLQVVKALYGLKQAGRCWYDTLRAHLEDVHGLAATESEPCIFVSDKLIVICYVDDGIVAYTPGSGDGDVFLNKLSAHFKIKLVGAPNHFIGWHITREPDGAYLIDQQGYIESLSERFEIRHGKPVPIAPGVVLGDGDAGDQGLFMEMVGSLLFASGGTRPDIATATSMLSRFMNGPTTAAVNAARGVLQYLYGTPGMGIRMQGPAPAIRVQVYTDASFAPDEAERRSRTGFIVFANGSPVHWRSSLQRIQAHSKAEAEYVAMSEGVRYGEYVRRLIQEMGGVVDGPIVLHQDNQTARRMAEEITTKKSKHIDICWHYVRGMVARGEAVIQDCRTDDMLADVLTKLLPRDKLQCLRRFFIAKGECETATH
jgi:hypothetical protein